MMFHFSTYVVKTYKIPTKRQDYFGLTIYKVQTIICKQFEKYTNGIIGGRLKILKNDS